MNECLNVESFLYPWLRWEFRTSLGPSIRFLLTDSRRPPRSITASLTRDRNRPEIFPNELFCGFYWFNKGMVDTRDFGNEAVEDRRAQRGRKSFNGRLQTLIIRFNYGEMGPRAFSASDRRSSQINVCLFTVCEKNLQFHSFIYLFLLFSCLRPRWSPMEVRRIFAEVKNTKYQIHPIWQPCSQLIHSRGFIPS